MGSKIDPTRVHNRPKVGPKWGPGGVKRENFASKGHKRAKSCQQNMKGQCMPPLFKEICSPKGAQRGPQIDQISDKKVPKVVFFFWMGSCTPFMSIFRSRMVSERNEPQEGNYQKTSQENINLKVRMCRNTVKYISRSTFSKKEEWIK